MKFYRVVLMIAVLMGMGIQSANALSLSYSSVDNKAQKRENVTLSRVAEKAGFTSEKSKQFQGSDISNTASENFADYAQGLGESRTGFFTPEAMIDALRQDSSSVTASGTIIIVDEDQKSACSPRTVSGNYSYINCGNIHAAMFVASAGDVIALKSGQLHIIKDSVIAKPEVHIFGTAESIILGNLNDSAIRLSQGASKYTVYSGFSMVSPREGIFTGIDINRADMVLIHNVKFGNHGNAIRIYSGVKVINSDNVAVINCLFRNLQHGIASWGQIAPTTGTGGVYLYNNDFVGNKEGINATAYGMMRSYVQVVNNVFYDNGYDLVTDTNMLSSAGYLDIKLKYNGFYNHSHSYSNLSDYYKTIGSFPNFTGENNFTNLSPDFRTGTFYSPTPQLYREGGWKSDTWHDPNANMRGYKTEIGLHGGPGIVNLFSLLPR